MIYACWFLTEIIVLLVKNLVEDYVLMKKTEMADSTASLEKFTQTNMKIQDNLKHIILKNEELRVTT